MSVSGIESLGAVSGALPAMPAMPSLADVDGTTQASAAGAASDATGIAGAAGAGATTGATGATTGAQTASGVEFGNLLTDGLDRLEGLQNTSSTLSVQAATGDLSAIHDYTIASAEASTATQLAVSLRNTGLQAFNQIMSMQV